MVDLFVVESPLQYLNAEEASFHFKSGINSVLLVLEGASKESVKQMSNIIRKEAWGTIVFINGSNERRLLYKCQSKIDCLLQKHVGEIRYVFIGEYRSMLMRHIVNSSRCQSAYLLDDGNVSIKIHKEIRELNFSLSKVKWFRKALNWVNRLQYHNIEYIKFFTVYSAYTDQDDVLNDYKLLRARIKNVQQFDDVVWFLGNNISEMGFVDRSFYLSQLKLVSIALEGKNVFYLPHRRENYQKFSEIEELGMKVITMDIPVEIALLDFDILPNRVASFCSSALDNIYNIYGESIVTVAFKYNFNMVKSSTYRHTLEQAYNQYELYDSSRFQIIRISNKV